MLGGTLGERKDSYCNRLPCIRRADVILILCCLCTALLLGAYFIFHRTAGSTVWISHDGVVLEQIHFNEIDQEGQTIYFLIRYLPEVGAQEAGMPEKHGEKPPEAEVIWYEHYPELPETGSYNLISLADGKITMEAADCRDQICVHHRPIMSVGESIICLPHKFVVEVTGSGRTKGTVLEQKKDDEQLDGVTR